MYEAAGQIAATAQILGQGGSGWSDAQAVRAEADELAAMVARLAEQRAELSEPGTDLIAALEADLAASADPLEQEHRLEQAARDVRALWLRAVAAETATVLRSPTAPEAARLATRHESFGYERDLQPTELEARCDALFDPVPAPWQARHAVFASGQAALLSVLLALRAPQPLRVQHLGGYFETRQLIETCPALCRLVETAPDVVIAEPLSCDGRFTRHPPQAIAAAARQASVLVLDTTLLARRDGLAELLAHLPPDQLVLRVASGLKLLQGGLELSNLGIVGLHARSAKRLDNAMAALRTMRTLAGAGLRFAEVLALEAPFVFDPPYADAYAAAVFAHNAALQQAVAAHNRIFAPPDQVGPAPYCVFALRQPDDHGYARLEARIAALAQDRRVAFANGGSFGFRGHRFEVVRPDQGAPFLRVAMGRRGGWSCRGIIGLMADIAAGSAA